MKTLKKSILFLIVISIFVGCTHKAPYTNRDQLILISQEEELALGESSYKKTLTESKVIKNTKDSNKVKQIGEKIAKVANQKDYKWEFNLIENEAKNAFCLPGGKVVVYTGILKVAKNDDQLATVISHEIAHALARHGAERVSASMLSQGIQVLGNIALSTQAPQYSKTFNIAYGLGSQYGVLMPYGRMQESEADEIGIYLMHKAGYNLNEALKFWENMSEGKKESIEFFSTHPNSTTRIENIKNIIKKIQNK
ncbi:peptidase M48 family protein [Malaciobacter mytili LMG 24559]|uniref:Peptidase M48 family protein n=1 Tax=Malaciobacter mytili LMG 24559 TaxID=1032238 RepID=A0AAX2AKM1_9BACT|nr:M48 family metallopeptidase [Malaciobacter mytili]AXH14783.1 peptidase, M48 family [Malaciobacter mytili LMG 24559]RXK16845.1 peptidase M48 family protein [Malaciobacter mytili LMG 24559]